MKLTTDKIIGIFYLTDGFCQWFTKNLDAHLIGNKPKKTPKMSDSEAITILILFHLGNFRNLKHFYLFHVQQHPIGDFPNTVFYNRFVELSHRVCMPMTLFLETCCLGLPTGISFADPTPVRACTNKRIYRNKVFKNIVDTEKFTVGLFYGFKLHLVINDKGEVLDFVITQANVDDRGPLKNPRSVNKTKGKPYAGKGYMGKKPTGLLFIDGLHLITSIRNNMKNVLMELKDKILLRHL